MHDVHRSGRSRRRWLALGVAAGLLAVVAIVLVVVVRRGRPAGEASVDVARERFGDTASTVEVATGPQPGVYIARGQGTEKLSLQSSEQGIGPVVPVTVTTNGQTGCFTMRVDYNANHWQTWDYCWAGGALTELGGQVFQRFDFVVYAAETLSTSVCQPTVVVPSAPDAPAADQTCRTSSEGAGASDIAATWRVVGDEDLVIGERMVATRHVSATRTMAGEQTGTGFTELWVDRTTGLPVRTTWGVHVSSGSIVGTVQYDEEGTWELTGLTT